MISLIEHVENISRFTVEPRTEILQVILANEFIIDDDSLFCYCIDKMPWGTTLTMLQVDGNGKKIEEWVKDIYRKNKCDKIQFFSKRWKAICRKYGFKPISVVCEREGIE